MAVDFRIEDETQAGARDPSKFGDLDSQTQRNSFRSLSAAALIYAGGYLLAFMSGWITDMVADGSFHGPPLFDTVVSALAIGFALFIARWGRGDRCTACQYAPMSVLFLIVASLGISIQLWRWEADPAANSGGVAWVGVWIVAFPAVVALPPRQVLLASLAAAVTVPLIAGISLLVHGVPSALQGMPALVIVQLSIPVFICVLIAFASSYRVFHLAKEVSKARRLGSYELMEKIGAGGMGEVWKAKHKLLARPAAVKLIRPESIGKTGDSTGARTMLRRFEREAQATSMLTSPHSITLYDFGIAEDGAFYYVMELLEGRDLKTLVQASGPIPAERAIHFLRAACNSLVDAHHRGLIHRDIKPANLFACRRGRDVDFIKLLDFGLVKTEFETGATLTQLTGEGITTGTPGFMAPEMITGQAPIDARTDIYALGCVAYWLLTGQLVFEGTTPMSILVQHANNEPQRPSVRTELFVPPQLDEIVMACLAKNPDHRPASAERLEEMLAEVAASMPAWTRDRAEAWWERHLPDLYALRRFDASAPTVVHA